MTLALRRTLPVTIVLALLTVLLCVSAYALAKSAVDDELDNSLEASAAFVPVITQRGSSAILNQVETATFGDEPGLAFAALVKRDGEIIQRTANQFTLPTLRGPYPRYENVPYEEEGTARVRVAPSQSGPRGLVVVGISTQRHDDWLASLRRLLAILGPLTWLVVSVLAYWRVSRALRPFDELRRRAAKLTGDERLPVPERDDELRSLAVTLNEMLARMQGARDRERRFIDDASHELRTPLALLRTELELALRQGDSESTLRTAIGSSIEEVDRLAELSESLLVVARTGETRRDNLRMSELLGAVAGRYGPGVRVEVDPPGLLFSGDGLLLEQALGSLVENALRHGAAPVTLTARRDDAEMVLSVADAGSGFPTGFTPRAFDRFSRGDEARGRGGAGLGLSIVQMIAEAHGGRVVAANQTLGGAQVTLTLPAAAPGTARPRE